MDSEKKPVTSSEPRPASLGLKAEATSFLRDASAYLQLRSELFGIEAKEAGQIYGKKAGLVIVGGSLLILSYILILVAVIGMVGAALDPSAEVILKNWIGAALILAGLHFLIGLFILRVGRKTGGNQELFEYTRNELQKEQEWLKHKRKR